MGIRPTISEQNMGHETTCEFHIFTNSQTFFYVIDNFAFHIFIISHVIGYLYMWTKICENKKNSHTVIFLHVIYCLLSVASYLMDRYESDIDLFI